MKTFSKIKISGTTLPPNCQDAAANFGRLLKSKLSVCLILFALVIYSGCRAAVENRNLPVNTVSNVQANNANSLQPPPPVKNVQPPSKSFDELEKINKEAFNSVPKNINQIKPVQSNVNADNSIASRPAPENSFISSTINEKNQPMEIRTFKDNSWLIKIEKIYISEENKVIKIYLKNGKTAEVGDGQISNFSTASVSEILNLTQSPVNK